MVAMQATDGQFYWLHTNHLNNSRAMTDSNGNLIYKGHFAPLGQSLSEWSSSGNNNLNSKKFTGYERDAATGLDFAQARMYTSARGRFLTPDPIGLKSADIKHPGSLNLYSYVRNDPVNYFDPEGKSLYEVSCSMVYVTLQERFKEVCIATAKSPDDRSGGGSGPDGRGRRPKTLRELLMEYIDGLLANGDCLAAIGEEKLRDWRGNVDRGDVKLYNRHQPAVIPNKGGQTVAQYWDSLSYVKQQSNGATVVSGSPQLRDGTPHPDGHFNNARVYNTIIINTYYESTTLIHEFLHWEVSGDHVAIADERHLNLARFGYNVDNDEDAGSAINNFLQKAANEPGEIHMKG